MSSIDKRVVEMKFDNKEFEAGIQKSLKSLETLQKSLDLKGATDGIKNIEKAVGRFDVSGMSKSIDSIADHFTWIGRTIDHELDRITSRAIAAGEQMVKSLSIDQISTGFSKFEDKTRSVATIMNATGKSVDEVNESLEKLNWFTDETSYNFTDMVNNVGKFTSVGVDLNDAVTAMQGIANAAALSGGGIGEASRAMYNFSQAMGTGKLLLQDWKSIELANMATTDFKNTLIESGLAMGTLVKQGDAYVTTTKNGVGAISSFKDANEGFRDSLSAGWITTEVMMDTFKKYGEYADEIYKITESQGITAAEAMEKFSDESMKLGERAFKAAQEARTFTDAIEATKDAVSTGWMQSFEIIFGNYEQAKAMWTDLANTLWDVFAGGAEARNDLLRETFQEAKNIVSTEDWDKIANDIPFVDTFRKAILDTAKDHGVALDNMYTDEAAFITLLDKGVITTDLLNEALSRTYSSGASASEGISGTTEKLAELEAIAKKVIRGDFGNGDKRVKALTEAGYDYKEVQSAVNKILKGQALTIETLSDAELKQIGYTDEEISQLKQLKEIAEKTGTPLNELIDTMSRPTGHELMIESASNAFEALMKVIQAVKDAWNDVFPAMTAERLYNIIERVRDFTESLIISDNHADKLRRTFGGVFAIFDLIGQSLSAGVKLLGGILEYLKPLGEWLLNTGSSLGDFFVNVSKKFRKFDVFGHVVDGILKVLSTFVNRISGIKDRIFEQLDASGLLNPIKGKWEELKNWIVSKGGIVGVIDNFFEIINDWVKSLDAVKIGDAIVKFVQKIKNSFKGFDGIKVPFKETFAKISDPLKDFGGGFIQTITESFSKIKDGFLKGVTVLGEAIDFILNFIRDRAIPVIGLIKEILALKLIKSITNITDSIGKVIEKFADIGTKINNILSTINSVIEKLGKAKAKEINSRAFLNIATSIGILVASLWVLTTIDSDKVYDALTVMGVLAGALLLFFKSIENSPGGGTKKIGGFTSLAVGILVLVKTMQMLTKMNIEDVGKSFGELAALMYMLSKFTNSTSSGFKASNGVGLLLTAISLQGFVLAMLELAAMDIETAVDGIIRLGALLTEVAGFTRMASKEIKISNGIGLFFIGISLQTFVLAMLELAAMDIETAVDGIIRLGALLTEVAGFTRMASKEIKFSNGVSLILIGTSMLIFGKSLAEIGSLDFETIAKGLAGMGGLMFEVSKFTKSSSKMSIGSGFGSLLGMSSLMVLVPIFKELSQIPDIEKLGISFGVAVGGIGKGIEALSHVKAGAGIAATMLEVAGIIALIVAVAEGIAGLIYKLGGDKAVSFLEGAKTILGLVGEGIGELVGGLLGGAIGGIGVGIADSIAAIGQSLTDFWTNATPFIEGVKGIKAEDMAGIGELSKAVLQLGEAEFLDALTSLVGGGEKNMEEFGRQLESLGPSLASFATNVSGVSGDSVKGAAEALGILADIDIPRSGGFIQKITGEEKYGNFGVQLNRLGRHLANFATSVSGIPDTGYTSMTKASQVLSELVGLDIPKTGSFMDYIVGRSDWGAFGSQLEAFGPGFRSFADKVNGIETAGLPAAAQALGELLKLDLPKTDWGIVQVFTGSTDWGAFGNQLEDFGSGLLKFSQSMNGVSKDSLSMVGPAVAAMKEVLTLDPPKKDGFIQWLIGEKDLGEFGNQLGLLGTGFATFNTNIGQIQVDKLDSVVGLLERLGEFANNISGTITDDFNNFGTAISMINDDNIDFSAIIDSISDWDDDFAQSGTDLAVSCIEAISEAISKAETPEESMKTLLNSLSVAIMKFNGTFQLRGSVLIDNFVSGLKSKVNDVTNAAYMLGNSGRGAFDWQYNSFYNSGGYLLDGFVNGMKSRVNSVTNAAYMLAHAANTAFNNALKIRSPSRLTFQSGEYFDEGFVLGLQNGSRSVENASEGIANSALSSFKSAAEIIQGIVNSNIDFQPTIRPVLDTSSIESGAGMINSIFSQTETIGLGGYLNPFIPRTLGQITSNMGYNETPLYVDNSDVIQAIHDLGAEFETMKNAIAQMKVVMDRNALVGEIIDNVDFELGHRRDLKNRRI